MKVIPSVIIIQRKIPKYELFDMTSNNRIPKRPLKQNSFNKNLLDMKNTENRIYRLFRNSRMFFLKWIFNTSKKSSRPSDCSEP